MSTARSVPLSEPVDLDSLPQLVRRVVRYARDWRSADSIDQRASASVGLRAAVDALEQRLRREARE